MKGMMIGDDAEVERLVVLVRSVLPTLEIKTASASAAGNKIQVRATWIEEGKKKLGYYSAPVIRGKVHADTVGVIVRDIFLIRSRVRQFIAQTGGFTDNGSRLPQMLGSFCTSFNTQDKKTLAKFRQEVVQKLVQVAVNDGPAKALLSRNQKRGRRALVSALDFTLSNGVPDDEVRDMVKEAIVRHTMNS